MKKLNFFGMATVVLLLLFGLTLTGCEDESTNPDPDPEFMTFVDNIENPTRRFKIFDNFTFETEFIAPPSQATMNLGDGDKLFGSITVSGGTAWTSDFSGTAKNMTSTNQGIHSTLVNMRIEMAISLVYSNTGNDISSVDVSILGNDVNANVGNSIIAGTYYREE